MMADESFQSTETYHNFQLDPSIIMKATPILTGRRELRKLQRLTQILLLRAIVINSCYELFSPDDFPHLREDGFRTSSQLTAFAFVQHRQEQKMLFPIQTNLFTCDRKAILRQNRNCSMLKAGRERRISSSSASSSSNQKERQPTAPTPETLVQQEKLARQKRLDQMDRRIQKLARRDERISILETKLDSDSSLTDAERAELEGLRRVQENFEEQYDPEEFSKEHVRFKALHNQVFCNLVRWCEQQSSEHFPSKVFFLDGPDGGTASYLIQQENFEAHQCFVANRHESTCIALIDSSGGLLPKDNVVHATCSEALNRDGGAFSEIDFTGYYFDGCGGYAPHIANMMSSALLVLEGDARGSSVFPPENRMAKPTPKRPIVVGYSLLGGTKNLVEKELEISRAMTIIARSRGMRMVHALDDPLRFGLPPNVPKLGGKKGTTFTTWLVLEPNSPL